MTKDYLGIDPLGFNPLGSHSDGADVSTAVALTIPAGAKKLMIQTHTQSVRFTLDGTTPEAAKGFQLKAGDPAIIIPLGNRSVVTVIQEAATADLQYQFGE